MIERAFDGYADYLVKNAKDLPTWKFVFIAAGYPILFALVLAGFLYLMIVSV